MDWTCRIAVNKKYPNFWIYLVKNCTSGQVGLAVDAPNLQLGSCSEVGEPGCFQDAPISGNSDEEFLIIMPAARKILNDSADKSFIEMEGE